MQKFKRLSPRRKVAAIVSAVLALALAVTGTWAVFNVNQETTNIIWSDVEPGGRGHDNFNPVDPNDPRKQVFFHNYGDSPLIVRVHLSEFMEWTESDPSIPVVPGTVREPRGNNTWLAHNPIGTNAAENGHAYREWFSWQMGSNNTLWFDRAGNYNPVHANGVFEPSQNWLRTATQLNQQFPDWENMTHDGTRRFIEVPAQTPITMTTWNNTFGNAPLPVWVVDYNGWAFWAQPVLPGQSTGLLLSEVRISNHPEESYWYGVHVRFNAVQPRNVFNAEHGLHRGSTPEAVTLLELITGQSRSTVGNLLAALDAAITAATGELARPGGPFVPANSVVEVARTAAQALRPALAALPADADPTPQQATDVTNAIAAINALLNRPAANRSPVVNWPTNLTATAGQTLGDITLPTSNTGGTPGTFSWVSPLSTPVGTAGPQTHQLRFTPTDGTAFDTVTHGVTVTVSAGGSLEDDIRDYPGDDNIGFPSLDTTTSFDVDSNFGLMTIDRAAPTQINRWPAVQFEDVFVANFPAARRNRATVISADPRLNIRAGANTFDTGNPVLGIIGNGNHAVIMEWNDVVYTTAQLNAFNAASNTATHEDWNTVVVYENARIHVSTDVTISIPAGDGFPAQSATVRMTFVIRGLIELG